MTRYPEVTCIRCKVMKKKKFCKGYCNECFHKFACEDYWLVWCPEEGKYGRIHAHSGKPLPRLSELPKSWQDGATLMKGFVDYDFEGEVPPFIYPHEVEALFGINGPIPERKFHTPRLRQRTDSSRPRHRGRQRTIDSYVS